MSNRAIGLLIAAAVAIFLLTQTFYTVDPTKQVLVRQFGALVGAPKTEPGLYMKIPLVQDIVRIDRRLLDYEADEFEIIAGDQKRLVVDAYARFKIVNARQFAETVPGGEPALRGILDSLINSEIRGVLSGQTEDYEIIFSMDPSPDRTEDVILEARTADPRIKLLKFSRRFVGRNSEHLQSISSAHRAA